MTKLPIIILVSISIGILLQGTFNTLIHLDLSPQVEIEGGMTAFGYGAPPAAVTEKEGNHHMCSKLLQQFRDDEIEIAKKEGKVNFRRAFVTISRGLPQSFYVSTHDGEIDSVRASIMRYQLYYETYLSKIIATTYEKKKADGKETIFLDVGANIGWFSLVAAAHGATKVYSFEPNKQNTIRFCESLSLNGYLQDDFIIPVPKGVGNKEDTRELYSVAQGNPGSFSFQKPFKNAFVVGTMEITTLDVFAEEHGWFDTKPSIPIFKLDVEHFEMEVMEGATRLLNSGIIESIAMELKPAHSKKVKSKICSLLLGAGYEFFMHGGYKGPNIEVKINYTNSSELVSDLQAKKYKENVLFRLKRVETR
jgi:FkbM family methyltransferase